MTLQERIKKGIDNWLTLRFSFYSPIFIEPEKKPAADSDSADEQTWLNLKIEAAEFYLIY